MNRGLLLAFMALGACSSGEPPQGVTGESGPRGGTTFRESTDTSRRGPSTERSAISLSVSGETTTSTREESRSGATSSTASSSTTASQRCRLSARTLAATLTVVDARDGSPITDAVVLLAGDDGGAAVPVSGPGYAPGEYAFGGNVVDGNDVGPGTYDVTVTAPGYASRKVRGLVVGDDGRTCGFGYTASSMVTVALPPLPPHDAGPDVTVRSSSGSTSTSGATSSSRASQTATPTEGHTSSTFQYCSTLDPSVPAAITVQDLDGVPILDAVFDIPGYLGNQGVENTTGGIPDGTYEVGAYEYSGTYTVQVSAPGYTTVVRPDVVFGVERGCQPYEPGSVLTVTLTPAGADAGTDAGSDAATHAITAG